MKLYIVKIYFLVAFLISSLMFLIKYAYAFYKGTIDSLNLFDSFLEIIFLTLIIVAFGLLLKSIEYSKIKRVINKVNVVINEVGFDDLTEDNFFTSCILFNNYSTSINILRGNKLRVLISVPLKGNSDKVSIIERFYDCVAENNIIEIVNEFDFNLRKLKSSDVKNHIKEITEFLSKENVKP